MLSPTMASSTKPTQSTTSATVYNVFDTLIQQIKTFFLITLASLIHSLQQIQLFFDQNHQMKHPLNPLEQHQSVPTDISHSFISLIPSFTPLFKSSTNPFDTSTVTPTVTTTVKNIPNLQDLNVDTSSNISSIEDELTLQDIQITRIIDDINNIPHEPPIDETTNKPTLIPLTPSTLNNTSCFDSIPSPNSTCNELPTPSPTSSNKTIHRRRNHFHIIQKQKLRLEEKKISLIQERNQIELQKVQTLRDQTTVLQRMDTSIQNFVFQRPSSISPPPPIIDNTFKEYCNQRMKNHNQKSQPTSLSKPSPESSSAPTKSTNPSSDCRISHELPISPSKDPSNQTSKPPKSPKKIQFLKFTADLPPEPKAPLAQTDSNTSSNKTTTSTTPNKSTFDQTDSSSSHTKYVVPQKDPASELYVPPSISSLKKNSIPTPSLPRFCLTDGFHKAFSFTPSAHYKLIYLPNNFYTCSLCGTKSPSNVISDYTLCFQPKRFNATINEVICSTCHEENIADTSPEPASCFECHNIITKYDKICISLPQRTDLSGRYYCIKCSKISPTDLQFEQLKKIPSDHHSLSSKTKLPPSIIPQQVTRTNYDSDSTPPTNNPSKSTKSSPTTAVINAIQRNFSRPPSDTSSLPSDADPFNYDHTNQYDQGYYDGEEQQLYQDRDKHYTTEDLNLAEHVAYGQGRQDEYNHIQHSTCDEHSD